MTFIVIGVDGGGTKTRVIVADELGTQLAEVVGPGSAVRPGEAEHSANVIAATLADALAACEMTHVVPKVLCVGVAGAAREPERQAIWQALAGRDLADEVVIHPDYSIALDDAFGDGPGVLLISGTGSAAFGRSPSGTTARCGGWGPVCGDEGSGAWIGRRALSVVTASADGREPETALVGAVLTAAQVNEPQELIAVGVGMGSTARRRRCRNEPIVASCPMRTQGAGKSVHAVDEFLLPGNRFQLNQPIVNVRTFRPNRSNTDTLGNVWPRRRLTARILGDHLANALRRR